MPPTAWISAAVLCTCACGITACGTEFPPEAPGGRIRGTVFYDGHVHQSFGRPTLQLYAADQIPTSFPYGSLNIEEPHFTGSGLDYEMSDLPATRFFVLARLVDLLDIEKEMAVGAYPNACAYLSPDGGNVVVTETAPNDDIDFTLYDLNGLADPCWASR